MKRQKKRSAPTASIANTCLSVVSIGNAPVRKVPQEGILEFDDPLGQ